MIPSFTPGQSQQNILRYNGRRLDIDAVLVLGLLYRCRERIYICLSELGESGFEQRGELLRAFQKVIQNS